MQLNSIQFQLTEFELFHSRFRSTQFYLVLDVTNLTAQEMMLNYTMNKNIVIEARESCRVPVPVERCPLYRRDQHNDDNEQNREFEKNFIPNENIFSLIIKIFFQLNYIDFQVRKSDADLNQLSCSKHISDSVQLNWSLLGTEIRGTASLRGISLSTAMLSLITVAPLKWGKHQQMAMISSEQ